jgi:hypothetical protein
MGVMVRGMLVGFAALMSLALVPAVAGAQEACPNQGLREAQHSTGLPDCRAYEMVTPSDKNPQDASSDAFRTRVSTSGDAVSYVSLMVTKDALGAGIANDYVSERTGTAGTNGWDAHSLSPVREPLSLEAALRAKDVKYFGEFSDDLSHAVLQSFTPLVDAPNVKDVTNLYLRTDALSSGQGTYDLLSDCAACAEPLSDSTGLYLPTLAASTPDLGHVIFEAGRNLLPGMPAEGPFCALFGFCDPRLYEWDHGTLRLAGVLPDGTIPPRSIAGAGATAQRYTMRTISADGSRIFFTVANSLSGTTGNIYMRVNHTSTVQLNASERTDCADNNPCTGAPEPDPGGPQPAGFQIASVDGKKIFFTSDEQLTDAPGGGLYMYDASLPDSDPHNLTLIAPAISVIGTSDDGSYLYFYTINNLPGQPPLADGAPFAIYLWHEGTLKFVGSLATIDNGVGSNQLGPEARWGNEPYSGRVTPDGKSLLFMSDSGIGLTGYDQASRCPVGLTCMEVYLYRTATDSVTCVSCNPSGAPATASATYVIRTGTSGSRSSTHINHPINDDGTRVFFETGERLLPKEDRNGKSDVYQYDVPTGELHLLSDGTSEADSHFLDASRDGKNVFFTTRDRLVGWDRDNSIDLYDARVGGGFPEPPAQPTECEGDNCQGAIATAPVFSAPSSSSFYANNNIVAPVEKVTARSLSRAQKLSRALKACKRKPKVSRKRCESVARKRFGKTSKAGRSK